MPRDFDSDFATIMQAYQVRQKLDIHRNDGTTLKLSLGSIATYSNWIRSSGDLSSSIDQAVDRVTVNCQNVSSDLGFDLASNLRLLDYAVAEYAKQYQSLRNPSLVKNPTMFRGVLANAEADEQHFQFDMIVDYESVGQVIGSRGLGPKCWWMYKNGVECTSASASTSCAKTRAACVDRGVEYEFGGWEFFELPVSTPPGSGDDGIGGGHDPCFPLDTLLWLPSGEVPIGELPLGKLSEPIPLVSFDKLTGEIDYEDEILEVFEHDTVGHFTFELEDGRVLPPTCNHRIWQGLGRFKPADDFSLGDRLHIYNDGWSRDSIAAIKWHSDQKIKVRNLHGRKHQTYFANRVAVSNRKADPDDPIFV